MKKAVCKLLAIIFVLMFTFQTSLVALADNAPDWQDANLSQAEFEDILAENPNNQITPLATGLIMHYAISISNSSTNSSTNLLIAGNTNCNPDVVKCGFTVVTVKRRTSSSASWSTYKVYEDLYRNNCTYTLSKTLPIPSGFQWRVYCTHYAKKSLFSTQRIDNSSNVIAIG